MKSWLLWPQVYKNTLCLQVPNPLSLPGSRPKLLPKLRVLLAKIYGASKAQHSELEVSAHGIIWLWFSLGNGCKWGGRKGDTRNRSTMNEFVFLSESILSPWFPSQARAHANTHIHKSKSKSKTTNKREYVNDHDTQPPASLHLAHHMHFLTVPCGQSSGEVTEIFLVWGRVSR